MDFRALADSRLFVVLCYCFSFGPWGILFALDFISPNWRTIHATRISGIIHLIFSTIPLGVAVFYLIVQQAANDIKEMMASCIAAIVALYHILRTISGLAQLRAYSVWCAKAVYCLNKLNVVDKVHRNPLRKNKDWLYQHVPTFGQAQTAPRKIPVPSSLLHGIALLPVFTTEEAKKNAGGEQESTAFHISDKSTEEEIRKYIDTRMLVNNQVIDNELFGSELPVRPCLPRCGFLQGLLNALRLRFDDWLCSRDIVRCSLRWTIAVLSNFGRKWVHTNNPDSFPQADVDLHLPYQMPVLKEFNLVLRAYQNTLATDVFFYNGGVLDDVDIYLRQSEAEADLSRTRLESLRRLNTKQVLYFLALMAQDGTTTEIPMEPVKNGATSVP